MSISEDRKKAQESKFAHDTEMQFKARARRNKLLGLWAAEKSGLSEMDAEDYAKALVSEGLKADGDESVIHKIKIDLSDRGVDVSETTLKAKCEELMGLAQDQILNEQ